MYRITRVSGRGVCTTVVHPEARPPFRFTRTRGGRGKRTCVATESVVPLTSPVVLSLRHATFFRPLSLALSLFPSFCSPIARAPRSSPSNPLRHALACVNHAYRFSFVGVSEGRSVVAHVFPLPSPFLAPSAPFFLTESPGAVPRHGANPLLKTHTRAVPDSFRTMARILAFLLPPCSLSLSLLFCYPHPFLFIPLLVTSYEALDAYPPLPPLYLRRFITSSTPLRRYFAF